MSVCLLVLAASAHELSPGHVAAIEKGLAFLERSQAADGSWAGNGGSYPVAMTALCGLAFLGAGKTPSTPEGRPVRAGLEYILARQQPNGLVTSGMESGRSMYGHGFSVLFLAQCYGMTESDALDGRIAAALRRGAELTAGAQSKLGGWYYMPGQDRDEGSVTITQVQGLRAARNCGVRVPGETIRKAVEYIMRSQAPDGGIRYTAQGGGSSRPPLTAAGVEVLFSAGNYASEAAGRALKALERALSRRQHAGHRTYFEFYAAQAVFQAGDETFEKYYPPLRDGIVKSQLPSGAWRGDYAGEAYGTSFNLLVLEIPLHYLPIFQR